MKAEAWKKTEVIIIYSFTLSALCALWLILLDSGSSETPIPDNAAPSSTRSTSVAAAEDRPPQAYLSDVLTHLPAATNQMIPQFTPVNLADARRGKPPKAYYMQIFDVLGL